MDTKFTKGVWATDSLMVYAVSGQIVADCDFGTIEMIEEESANASLIAAAPDMYKSLERQRAGLVNLIDLNLITESHIESVRHEISLIDNELSRARGE